VPHFLSRCVDSQSTLPNKYALAWFFGRGRWLSSRLLTVPLCAYFHTSCKALHNLSCRLGQRTPSLVRLWARIDANGTWSQHPRLRRRTKTVHVFRQYLLADRYPVVALGSYKYDVSPRLLRRKKNSALPCSWWSCLRCLPSHHPQAKRWYASAASI
jgi:hypothetical protein